MHTITIISSEYPPFTGGGVGNTCKILIDYLSKINEFNVNLITIKTDNTVPDFEKYGNVRIYRIKTGNIFGLIKPRLLFPFKLFFAKKAKEIIKNSDVIHSLNFRDAALIPTYGKPLIVNITDYYAAIVPANPFQYPYKEKGKLLKYLNYQVFKLLDFISLKKATLVLANSKFTEKTMAKIYGINKRKINVVYKGIESRGFERQLKKDIDILFVGSRFETKGAKELIYSIAQIKKEYPNVKCIMAGNPSSIDVNYDALVKKLGLEKNVKIIGRINNEKLKEYYLRSKIYYLGSYMEAMGQTLIEAMLGKCAIVATNVGGVPEIIDKSCGVLIEPMNINQITDSVLLLLNNPKMIKRFAKNGCQRAEKLFNSKNMIDRYIRLYRELAI